jgi:hypothetical protein
MMDFILEAWVSGSIERAKAGWMLGAGKRWKPGEKLKLLFAETWGRMCGWKRCCGKSGTFWARTGWNSA